MKKLIVFAVAMVLSFGVSVTPEVRATTNSAGTPVAGSLQNKALDFSLANATGYGIKGLYIGATGTGDWAAEDEVLHGRKFNNGDELAIQFNPRATAEKWDIMVEWDDGSGKVEWIGLKLTEIEKVTLKYDKASGKTTAVIE